MATKNKVTRTEYKIEFTGSEDSSSVHIKSVIDGKEKLRNLKDNPVVYKGNSIRIAVDYPLAKNTKHKQWSKSLNGYLFERQIEGKELNLSSLIFHICQIYKEIYEREEQSMNTKVPKIKERIKSGGLINRPNSDGEFGIWGHDLNDLYLELIEVHSDGIVEIYVGS